MDSHRLLRRMLRALPFAAFAAFALLVPVRLARAEGSLTLVSSGGSRPYFEYRNDFTQNSTIRRLTRVFVYANAGETLLVASSANGTGNGHVRWVSPTGATGSAPKSQVVQGKTVALISDVTQEQAGPLPNAGGYRAHAIPVGAGQGGIWELRFASPDSTSGLNPPVRAALAAWTQNAGVGWNAAWDVTVRSAAGAPIGGRVWVDQFAMNVGNPGVAMSSQFFVLTRDGFQYRVDANGVQPFGFNFFANNKGFRDGAGVPLYHSVPLAGSNIQNPDAADTPSDVTHKMFLTSPALDLPASAPGASGVDWLRLPTPFVATATNLTFVGVDGTPNQAGSGLGGTFRFDSDGNANYTLSIDINGNNVFTDAVDRTLVGVALAGSNSIAWDGRDGLGARAGSSGSPSQVRAHVQMQGGEVHFPYADAEDNPLGIILERQNGTAAPDYTVFFDDRPLGGAFALPPAGASSAAGAHAWSGAFGDIRGMDTWTFVPGALVQLGGAVVIRDADLELVSKTHAPEPFVVGQPATYTFVVRNNGPDSAYAAAVLDTIPAAVLSPAPGAPATSGGATVLSQGITGQVFAASVTLPPAATTTFTVTGTVSGSATSPVINRALVLRTDDSGDLDDQGRTGAGNNGKRDTATVIAGTPDLTVDKRHSETFVVGVNGAYRLVVTNVGLVPTVGTITLTDTLPNGLTFVSAAGGFTGSASGQVVTLTRAAAIAAGDSAFATLTVAVDSTAVPQVTNSAVVSGGGDTNPGNDRDTDPTDVEPAPDLAIDKSHAAPFTVGQQGVWTVAVTNVGAGATFGTVTVRDTIAAGLTVLNAFGPGWGISIAGQIITAFTTDPIDPGSTGSFSIIVDVTAAAAPGVVNSATVSGGGDSSPGNNRDSDPTPVNAFPDLTVDKRHTEDLRVDTPFAWTFVVSNIGAAPTSGTYTVRDTLPAGVAYVASGGAGWATSYSAGVVTATNPGPLAQGDSALFTVTVIPDRNAWPGVDNFAWVTGGGDASPDNNWDQDPTPFTTEADLLIQKTATGTFNVGANATYDLSVVNLGTGPTSGTITVRDTLPAGLTYVSGTGTNWTVSAVGQVVTATTGQTIFAGFGNARHITLTVAVGAAAQPVVTNFATVEGGGDVEPGNNRDGDTTAVSAPDLALDKRHTQAFVPGQNGVYTLVVRNVGSAPTTGTFTVTDTLPAGLAYVSATGGGFTGSASGAVVTLTRAAALAAGDSAIATLTVSVSAAAVPGVVNSATVSGGGDGNPGNNRDSDPTEVGAPDLTVDKRHTQPFVAGQNGVYTLVVRNVGSAPTSGTFTVTDTLPAGLTYVSASGPFGASASGQIVTLTRSAVIAVGDSATATLTVLVDSAAPASVVNSATVAGGGDQNPANDRDSDPTDIATVPDLAISKFSAGTFSPGGTGTYALNVRNVGLVASSGQIAVRDTLPAGLTWVSGGGPGWNVAHTGQIVTGTTNNVVAPGGNSGFTVTVAIDAAAPTPLINFASLTGGGDTSPGNNREGDTTSVVSAADLALAKSHAAPFVLGTTGLWTFVVTNVGTSATSGAYTVTDTLPAGVNFVTAEGVGWTLVQGGPITILRRSTPLAVGDTSVFTLRVTPTPEAVPQVTNFATVSGGGDTNPANDRASDPTPVVQAPDLAVLKTTGSTFSVGANVVYDINVTNVGSAVTVGTVTVTDTLPNGLTYVSSNGPGWTFTASGQVVIATATSAFNPLQSRSFTITATVGGAAIPGVTNTAEVAGGGDVNPTNNRSSVTDIFGNGPDLSIAKRHTAAFDRGATAAWTIVVRNVGVQPTTGTITVNDPLPIGVQYSSATGAGWTFANDGPLVSATTSAVFAVGDSSVITLNVVVLPTAGATLLNTATVSTPGDVNNTNNSASDAAIVAGLSALRVVKTASPQQVEVGGVVDYRIGVTNTGQSPITNISVTDVLPPGFAYVVGSTRVNGLRVPDPMGAPGPSLQFALGTLPPFASFAAGDQAVITYRVAVGVAAGTGSATNVAVARTPDGGVGGSPLASNTGTATVQVVGGVFGDLGIIAGKVWIDCDCAGDHRQGAEELGIPGVRVTLEDGTSAITDAEGKYSFANVRPRLHVVRVDESTLPPGAVLVPLDTRNGGDGRSRFVDLKAGEFHRADFAERSNDERVLEAIRDRRTKGEPWAAMSESDSGVVEFMPGDGFADAKELALVVAPATHRGVEADGRSALGVGVKVPASNGDQLVTIEASAGRWIDVNGNPAPDLDPVAAGVQSRFEPANPNRFHQFAILQAPTTPQDVKIRVTQGESTDSAVVRFVPERRSLLASGLAEARLELRSLDHPDLKGFGRDRFEDALKDASIDDKDGKTQGGARGAMFARGDIGNGVNLTGRWDSEQDPERRLFRDIRPFEGYDITGDASQHEWDAQSTSRLYLRLDRQASFAQFGDFSTPVRDAQRLGAFTRSMNGGLARASGRLAEVDGFVSEGRSRQVVDEFRGQGISGPYALSRAAGLINSEQVELVTRDRNQPSRVLSTQRLIRFTDYTIEPFTGSLLFRRPVPSLDGDLNPVSVRVTYETEGVGETFWTYGGSFALTPDPRVKLGVSASRDEDPARPGNLASVDLTLTPVRGVQMSAEFARSDSGTTFLSGDTHGQAWRAEIAAADPRVNARVWAQRAETGFQNTSSLVAAGRQELGASLRVPLPTGTSLFASALRTEALTTGGRRDGVEAGASQKLGIFTAEGAYRWASETASRAVTGTTGVWPSDLSTVRGKLSALTPLPGGRRATLVGEFEQDLDVSGRRRGGGGAELPISARTRVYLRHEDITAFGGPFALNDRERASQTVLGVASDELRDGHVFSEYRARSAFAGRETEAAMGVRNRWTVAPGVRLDGSFEQITVLENRTDHTPPSGDAGTKNAFVFGAGVEVTRDPLTKVTGRIELRTTKEDRYGNRTSTLGTLGIAHKLNRDWTGLFRTSLYDGLDQEVDLRTQAGVAWRQTDRNVWNALARFENRVQRGTKDFSGTRVLDHTANILSAHANVKPTTRFTLMGQTAAKWASDGSGGLSTRTDAQLLSMRALWDLTQKLDAGLSARALASRGLAEKRFGAGAELGMLVAHGLRASAGYNVFGFRDADMADLDHTDHGPYVQMGFKFDEHFLRSAAGSK